MPWGKVHRNNKQKILKQKKTIVEKKEISSHQSGWRQVGSSDQRNPRKTSISFQEK